MRIKICGLTRREDVLTAQRLGVDYVGVVLSAGFGRSVDPRDASDLVDGVSATRVAVLVDEATGAAVERAVALGAGVVQLHGEESPEHALQIRREGPWRVWKAVRAQDLSDVRRAVDVFGDAVDGFLLEGKREGVVGGGGARLDPIAFIAVSEILPPDLDFVLAGGLTPGNVGDAMARLAPQVVDVSSGVERERGRKDPDLMRRFVEEVRGAALDLSPESIEREPRNAP